MEILSSRSVPFNVTAVVTSASAPRLPELLMLLSSFRGARGLGLDLLVGRGRGRSQPPPPDMLHESGRRLREAVLALGRVSPRPIVLREMELLKKAAARERGFFCEAHCQRSLAVTPDGRLWPCGQAAGAEEFSMGTVEFPQSPARDFSGESLQGPDCRLCPLRGRCPGECPSRLYFSPGGRRLACCLYLGLSGLEMPRGFGAQGH
jgi:uncharacterized protein